ncbi:unnamed protein product [Dibothriocephalus latus]|uniref:Uncharacterized protein n=1 Tax=Dibothriocephalus latus TaxID=60516 RepID=A0A3P7MDV6_DIBLA|nr:unnamed protein product [Dibothriocephalus latus]
MKLNFKFTNLFGTAYKCGNLSYTNNGSCLLSSVGNQVTIFHLLRDEARTIAVNSHFNIEHIALSPILPILFTVDCNGGGSLVSMLTGNVITTYNFRHPVSAACFSPDGKYLAVSKNHCIMVFLAPEPSRSVNSLELYRFLYGFQDKIKNIDWSSDSKFIIAGSDDMTARVLAVKRTPKLIIYTLSGHKAPVYAAFVADESLDCVTVSVDGEVRLWECDTMPRDLHNTPSLETKKAFTYRNSLSQRINETITTVKFHRKLKMIVTAFESGIVMLHQLPEFILIDKAKLMADPVSAVAINPSGDWIAVGSEEHGQLAVWEWRSKSCHLRLSSHANEMTGVTFSPDGLLLATAGRDAKVKIWQVASGRALVTFSDHQAPVTQVAFPATKPKVVISSSLDGTVRAFDLTRYDLKNLSY